METINIGYVKLYIQKESGNLYIKDKQTMESKPIKFGLYGADNELIGLRDYMNIRNINIKQAIEELEKCNAVLVGHVFNVMFYTDEDKDLLLTLLRQ